MAAVPRSHPVGKRAANVAEHSCRGSVVLSRLDREAEHRHSMGCCSRSRDAGRRMGPSGFPRGERRFVRRRRRRVACPSVLPRFRRHPPAVRRRAEETRPREMGQDSKRRGSKEPARPHARTRFRYRRIGGSRKGDAPRVADQGAVRRFARGDSQGGRRRTRRPSCQDPAVA